jgi:hypothetical protein
MSVNGPWLDGTYLLNHRNDPWATFGKFAAIAVPSPTMLWVLVDESAVGVD